MRDPTVTRRLALWPSVKVTLYTSFIAWLFIKWLQNRKKTKIGVCIMHFFQIKKPRSVCVLI
jgi:hypothetical protein